jgi:hypothetical protein
MKHLLILTMLSLTAAGAYAQAGNSSTIVIPLAGTSVLRDAPDDKYNAHIVSLEAPEPDGEFEQAGFRALKADVERRFPHRRAARTGATAKLSAAVPPPVIERGFVPDSFTAIPPDNYMAANNDTGGINVMNTNVTAVNTVTGGIYLRKSLFNFTVNVGLGTTATANDFPRYDPKVMYDPEMDRFYFVTLVDINERNWIVVGFSQSNDPAGGWNWYKFYGDYAADSTWFDYPTIAITHNEVFLTGNKLVYNGSFQTGFRKSVIYEMRKRDGYAGNPLTMRIWDSVNYGGAPIRNIFPVKGGGSLKGPEQYFLSVRNMSPLNDSVFLIRIADTLNGTNNTLTVQPMKSNLSYGFPPNGRQPIIPDKLQTNDARVLGAFVEGGEIQFVSTTVQPATGADAIYHGIITNYTTTPTVTASYITVDTLDFAYPNISYAGTQGGAVTSIISFDYSGPHKFPGFGAVFWNGAGHSDLLDIKQGQHPINMLGDTIERWGDYSGSQPKWNSIGRVWAVGIWGWLGNRYGDWTALLRSPYIVGVPNVNALSNKPVTLFPNPSSGYIRVRFKLDEETRLHFALYSMSGTLIDMLANARCERGENELQFSTAALPAGQYLIRATGSDGEVLVKKTFVKE